MKKHFRKILIVALVLALVFNRLDVQAEANTYTVSNNTQFTEALEAAQAGDTIILNGSVSISAGSTVGLDAGTITIKRGVRNVQLSLYEGTEKTIIKNVVFDGGEIASSTPYIISFNKTDFIGCTFKGVTGTANGGALCIWDKYNTIDGCTFKDNVAGKGSHIFNRGGSLNIKSSTFTGGKATDAGGALYLASGITKIEGCVITGNEVTGGTENTVNLLSGGYGGGINNDSSTTTVKDTLIYANTAVGGKDVSYNTTSGNYTDSTTEAYYTQALSELGLYHVGWTETENSTGVLKLLEYRYTDTDPNPPADPEPTNPEPEDNPTGGNDNPSSGEGEPTGGNEDKPDDPAQDNPSSGDDKPADKPDDKKEDNKDNPTGGNSSSTTTTDSHTEDNSTHSDNHSTDNHSTTDNHSSQSDNHSTTDSHDTTDKSTHTEDKHTEDNSKHDSHNKTDNRSYTYNTTEGGKAGSEGVTVNSPITLSIPAQKATEGAKKEPEVTQATTINIYTESGKITPDGKGGYTLDLVEAEPQATPLSSGKEEEKKTDKTEVTEILLLVYLMGKDALLGVVSKLKR